MSEREVEGLPWELVGQDCCGLVVRLVHCSWLTSPWLPLVYSYVFMYRMLWVCSQWRRSGFRWWHFCFFCSWYFLSGIFIEWPPALKSFVGGSLSWGKEISICASSYMKLHDSLGLDVIEKNGRMLKMYFWCRNIFVKRIWWSFA